MTDTGAPLLKEDSKLLGNVKVEKTNIFTSTCSVGSPMTYTSFM
jgi:hypothetical protein